MDDPSVTIGSVVQLAPLNVALEVAHATTSKLLNDEAGSVAVLPSKDMG
jgi:hypothetical protein